MAAARPMVVVAACAAALAGCDGEGDGATAAATGGSGGAPAECLAPTRLIGDACREPGVQDDGCPAGTLGLGDGTCEPAGVSPEMCGEGFVHDGDVGCDPILPARTCPFGQMAVPGEAECRPVAPCALGKWGDIAVDASTEHVDGSYAGADSDGSAAKPWATIDAALAAADPGAIVAVAAGSYAEDVLIQGSPVVLWGVCPDQVEIVGSQAALAAIDIRGSGATGTVVRGVAVTGSAFGIALSGSERVLFDSVWVHDNDGRGINVQSTLGSTSFTLRGSLVEQNSEIGVFVSGSGATLEATVVRGTLSEAGGLDGRGIELRDESDTGTPSMAVVRGSVVEHNHEVGVDVLGSEVAIDATVVRGTLPDAQQGTGRGVIVEGGSKVTLQSSVVDQNHSTGVFVSGSEVTVEGSVVRHAVDLGGRGISINPDGGVPSTATLRSSLVENSHEFGVYVSGSGATIEATVVRGVQPDAQGFFGRGINVQKSTESGARSTAVVRASLVDQNREGGVVVEASDATIDGTVVRGTELNGQRPSASGIQVQTDAGGEPSTATIARSFVENNRGFGVFVYGSSATVEAAVVRATQPDALGLSGRGIHIQVALEGGAVSDATLRTSLVEQSHEFGIAVGSANATIESCLVRATLPNMKGHFGDGISVFSPLQTANLSVRATRIEDSGRAGVSNFAGSASIGDSIVQCAAFDLAADLLDGKPFTFDDLGGNACGCPTAAGECLVVTAGIEPPAPVASVQ